MEATTAVMWYKIMIETRNFGGDLCATGQFEVTINDEKTTCYRMVTDEKDVYSACLSVGDKSFHGSGEHIYNAFGNLYAALSAYLGLDELKSSQKELCVICKDTKLMFFYDISKEEEEKAFQDWWELCEYRGCVDPDELLSALKVKMVFNTSAKGEIPYEKWMEMVDAMPYPLPHDLVEYMKVHNGLPAFNDPSIIKIK